jgi:hypothetical protein
MKRGKRERHDPPRRQTKCAHSNTPTPPLHTHSFPPVTSITILKSSPTCLITQFPHQEKAKIDSESSTSKLFQTCEMLPRSSAMCHLYEYKPSWMNECRQMCHPEEQPHYQAEIEMQKLGIFRRSLTLVAPMTIIML